jgi:hypothetical protein
MSFISPFGGDVIQPTDVSYRSISLTANTTLSWPVNGNAAGDVIARIMDVSAATAGLTITLPAANQASVGQDSLIRNVGSNSFNVVNNAGGAVATVAASQSRYIYISSNTTAAGTWGSIAFGVGSSSADAATLAGYGIKAISTTLNSSHPVTTFSANYTTVAADRSSTLVWTGGSGTLTITSAATLGNDWFVLVRNGGTGNLTVTPSSGQLIDGANSISLAPGDSCMICCSGAAFYTVGLGRSTQFNFTQLTKAVSSGTYTLTASEAANVIQKYTGTITSAVTVVLPQTIQVYYITNQASSSITFTTGAAGAATVAVPGSQQVILLCDSVNLFNASTIAVGGSSLALVNGSAGSPSLSFLSEASTGMYYPGTGEIALAILGAKMFGLTATGLTVPGTGTFTGGISGGVF